MCFGCVSSSHPPYLFWRASAHCRPHADLLMCWRVERSRISPVAPSVAASSRSSTGRSTLARTEAAGPSSHFFAGRAGDEEMIVGDRLHSFVKGGRRGNGYVSCFGTHEGGHLVLIAFACYSMYMS